MITIMIMIMTYLPYKTALELVSLIPPLNPGYPEVPGVESEQPLVVVLGSP